MPDKSPEQLLLAELQLLLAEKRTYYALLRTGLAVVTVPLSVILFLAATESVHGLFSHEWMGEVVVLGLLAISAMGLSLFYRAQRKIQKLEHLMSQIKLHNKRIAEILI